MDTRRTTEGPADEKNGDSHQLRTLRRIIISLALQLVTVTVFQEPDGAQRRLDEKVGPLIMDRR